MAYNRGQYMEYPERLFRILRSTDSRLTSVNTHGRNRTDYTLTLLPQRPATGGGHFIHGRELHTITAKTICQMERVNQEE